VKTANQGGVASIIENGKIKTGKRERVASLKTGKRGGVDTIIEGGELKAETERRTIIENGKTGRRS